MSRLQRFVTCLLLLLVLAITIEHKYDKWFRYFSLTLIPEGLKLPKTVDKNLYFYLSDFASILLSCLALFAFKIPARRFFFEKRALFLWIVFFLATLSITTSPLSNYPVAYARLLQLLTPFLLFAFLANGMPKLDPKKLTRWIFSSFVFAGLFQSILAICQYFSQHPLGLRLLSEPKHPTGTFFSETGNRWILDHLLGTGLGEGTLLMRASGTLPHTNVLGGVIALSLLASYALIMEETREWMKRLLLALMPLQMFAMGLSFSRSAFFGWALGTLVFALLMFWKTGVAASLRNRTFRSLLIAAALSPLLVLGLLKEQLSDRGGFLKQNELSQKSDQGRIFYQEEALKHIAKNPFLGVGFQQYSFVASKDTYLPAAHNIFFFLASETGLISLFAFLLFLGFVCKDALNAPLSPQTITLLSLFTLFLFIGMCDFYPLLFQQGKLMFFTILGLLALHGRKEKLFLVPKKESWRMFDEISPTYDAVNRILSLGLDRGWRRKVRDSLPKKENLALLDLATGTGDQLFSLFDTKATFSHAAGIDLSEKMLEIAKKKGALKPYAGKITWRRGDAQRIPFEDATFDAATFSFGIRNVENPLLSLQDIYRVLKPEGKVLILEFSLPGRFLRPFYLFYLRHILPFIGGLLSSSMPAYRYLNTTIETFPSGEAFLDLLRTSSFQNVKRYPMALGAVTLYSGEKL